MNNESKLPSPMIKVVVSVYADRRFDLDRSIIKEALGVELPPGGEDVLWMFPRNKMQLRVLRKEHPLSKVMESYEAGTLNFQPDWEADDDQDADKSRKLSNFMKIQFNRRGANDRRTTLRIKLPTEAIELGYAKINSSIVVLISGQVFELWHPDIWNEACKISNVKEFTKLMQEMSGI